MKTRKLIGVLIISLLLILLGTTKSNASLYLNNLAFTAQINEDGSMDVVETWNIDISETNTLYKTFKIDTNKYSGLKDISVKEITGGKNRQFTESKYWKYHMDKNYYFGGINQNEEYEIAWGVGLDNSSDTRVYQISYTVTDVIKKYGDCAELYWKFVGEDFEVNANKITGKIKLPKPVQSKEELRVWGHTEYLNGEIYVTDLSTIDFNLNNYKSGNFVEVRLLTPTYVFQNLEYNSNKDKILEIVEDEEKWTAEANRKREKRDNTMKIVSGAISAVITIIGLWVATKINKYKKELEKNKKIVPDIDLDYYRELPDETATPAEACFVLNGTQDVSKILSATILDLTLKGYLKAEQIDKKINIEVLEKDRTSLAEDEKQVLELIEKVRKSKSTGQMENTVITVKDLEKYIEKHPSSFENVKNKLEKIAKDKAQEKGKFDKKVYKQSEKYVAKSIGYSFIPISVAFAMIGTIAYIVGYVDSMIKYILISGIFTIVISIINIIMCSILASRFNGFTQKGVNEKEQWKAFKKYMEDFSLLDEKEVPQLVIWEKYLVYATAFGIAEKVIKQLKIKYPELSSQDTLNNMVLFSVMSGPHGLNPNFISSLNTSTAHMYSSTYSSGSGAGGGFSGGGGGRWPEEVGGGGR